MDGALPRCHHPGCSNPATHRAVTSLDFLNDVPGAVIALKRDGMLVVVGKFTPWGLGQIIQRGDELMFEDGHRITCLGASPDPEVAPE